MKCTPEREGIQVIIYGKGHGYSIKRSHLIQSTRECHHHHNFYIYRRHSFLYYHFIVYMYAVCMRALHSTAAKAASAEDHFFVLQHRRSLHLSGRIVSFLEFIAQYHVLNESLRFWCRILWIWLEPRSFDWHQTSFTLHAYYANPFASNLLG